MPSTVTPILLGRKVQHDTRSLHYPALTGPQPIVDKTWRLYGSDLDQGYVGACTGFAMTHALNSKPNHYVGQRTLRADDAYRLYSLATQVDEFPGAWNMDGTGEDTGSSALGVAKAAQRLGHITSYRWAFGIDHVLRALMDGPVLIGSNWHSSMFHPAQDGLVRPEGPVVGGHEYLLVGRRRGRLLCQNSWGSEWGVHGRFSISPEDLDALLQARGDAMQVVL